MIIILQFYAPAWFYIKSHPKIKDGARNFFHLIKLASVLRIEERRIIHNVLLTNSFFAHHENVLLSMLTDPMPRIRNIAVRQILLARKKAKLCKSVRKFVKPTTLNFKAKCYYDMIDFNKLPAVITEPPLTMKYTKKTTVTNHENWSRNRSLRIAE